MALNSGDEHVLKFTETALRAPEVPQRPISLLIVPIHD